MWDLGALSVLRPRKQSMRFEALCDFLESTLARQEGAAFSSRIVSYASCRVQLFFGAFELTDAFGAHGALELSDPP